MTWFLRLPILALSFFVLAGAILLFFAAKDLLAPPPDSKARNS
jgi:hypothetical protein